MSQDVGMDELRARGRAAAEEGDLDAAMEALGRAALLSPRSAGVHAELGAVFRRAGRIEAARRAYERALAVDPSHAAALRGARELPPPPPQRANFAVGQVLQSTRSASRYTVLATRRGGFGAVYIVRDRDGKTHALKSFDARLLWSDDDRRRFLREASTWISLDPHPHVVTAHWAERIEGMPCLVMEYVAGGDLSDHLAGGPLAASVAVRFGIELCDGMQHAWSRLGLVHRDLKPSNCLLSGSGALKVTDFGLAKCLREAQVNSLELSDAPAPARHLYTAVAGTPTYMAPEQFRPGAPLDTRTDVYAFGVMLYEMLAGDRPPPGGRAKEYLDRRRIHRALRTLVLQCVEADPERRPATFAEVREGLAAAHRKVGRGPVPAVPRGGTVSATTWVNRSIAFRHLGMPEEAMAAADRGLALSQSAVIKSRLWQVRGLALCALDRRAEALESYDQGLASNEREPSLWQCKGAVLAELERYEEALVCYDRTLAMMPELGDAWRNKAASLTSLGRHDEAAAAFERAAELLPRDAELFVKWSYLLSDQGRYDEALERTDLALEIAPRYDLAWLSRGNILRRAGRGEEALAAYDRAVEVDADYSLTWANRALALHSLGRPEDAAASCARALEIAPGDDHVLAVRRWLETH
jgi:eukaryotic-like serine/threonine-protein kinase